MSLTQRLRHRGDLQGATTTQDSVTGETVETWANVAAAEPVEVVPLSGREFLQSGAKQSGVDTRITCRYRAGVLTSMRWLVDGEIYNIKAVLPDPTLRKHLTMMCERGVSAEGM